MTRLLTLAAFLAVAASLNATPLVGRGAGMLSPKQFLGEIDFGYSKTASRYDWANNEWVDLIDTLQTSTISAAVIAGFAPMKNWEVLLHAPLAAKSQGSFSSLGVGDVELHTRYALIAGKTAPVKLTAAAGIGLPTADKSAKPKIGDGKLSGALGLIATTKKFGLFTGHVRAAYWLNGKTNDTTKAGNMFEYVVKGDFDFTKTFQVWLSLVGTMQGRTEINGTAKEKTEQDRHVGQVGLLLKPKSVPVLTIRPKVGIPLQFLSRGGQIAPWVGGLDFWVTVPQPKKK